MRVFAGIDNSSLDHKVKLVNDTGKEILSMTISNDLFGFNQLDKKLCLYPDVIIGFELPHGPIVDYLKAKNYSMFSLNPLKIKRYKESVVVSGNKTDNIDALAIAEYLRNN
jgi:transposase